MNDAESLFRSSYLRGKKYGVYLTYCDSINPLKIWLGKKKIKLIDSQIKECEK